jgi:hypothetical protein
MVEPKTKPKKTGSTTPVEEEEENLGKASPKDISDTPATILMSDEKACGR